MYIIYSGSNKQYASAARSSRTGSKTHIDYTYLGSVIDREKGIYHNKERGFFTYDPKADEYGDVPADFTAPSESLPAQARKRLHYSVDFGDAFLMDGFLHRSGLMKVIDRIDYGNRDTLHAMVLFYMLSDMANCDACHWYEGSIARLLYPNANLRGQRISDFLSAIGTKDQCIRFQQAYIQYVLQSYNPDKNILVDSTGLPNRIHFPLTRINVHDGKVSQEVRLIFVVQKSTGLPLYYQAVPGNIVDMSTLERVMLHLNSLGIDIDSCLIDAGYDTADNLDLFYAEDHTCKIGFITRVKANDKRFRELVEEKLPTLDDKENLVRYEDRYLFIVKKKVCVGKDENNPAWMYLGLDCDRMRDEQHKLLRRARKNGLSLEEVYEAMQSEGLFGVISGREYSCDEILPAYYQRQQVEQTFDFAKNYTKLLPLRTCTEETFQGHLLLSYISSCAVKLLQQQLKTADLFLGSRLRCMRNQKCTIYSSRIVTDNPQAEVNRTYELCGIPCPAAIPIVDGRLQYTPPVAVPLTETAKILAESRVATIEREKAEAAEAAEEKAKKAAAKAEAERQKAEARAAKAKVREEKAREKAAREAEKAAKAKIRAESKDAPQKPKPAVSTSKEAKSGGNALDSTSIPEPGDEKTCKSHGGRPKGSKNKKHSKAAKVKSGRGPGRPKGSKNKKTLAREALQKRRETIRQKNAAENNSNEFKTK